nr:MAG TPA: hypothetical protein [Caudoviricetes sp.]
MAVKYNAVALKIAPIMIPPTNAKTPILLNLHFSVWVRITKYPAIFISNFVDLLICARAKPSVFIISFRIIPGLASFQKQAIHTPSFLMIMSLVSHHVASLDIVIVNTKKWETMITIRSINNDRRADAFHKFNQIIKAIQLYAVASICKLSCFLAGLSNFWPKRRTVN